MIIESVENVDDYQEGIENFIAMVNEVIDDVYKVERQIMSTDEVKEILQQLITLVEK